MNGAKCIRHFLLKLSKINKIGKSFKSAFGSEKIGWGSNWITITK